MGKTKVLIVDDHGVVRKGLRLLLENEGDIEVVGEASDGFEGVEKATELLPDVIIMDITMPRLNGLEATKRIRSEHPGIAVLFLTIHEGEEFFFQALKSGGSGFIPKSADALDMLAAVRAVKSGNVYLHPSVSRSLVSDYLDRASKGENPSLYERLTSREKEILHLIAEGHTNRQIAETLVVSVNTVHNHSTSIMDKLGLHSRTELVKYAIRKGLVSNES